MTTDELDTILDAIKDTVTGGAHGEEDNIVGALYAIARGLDRIGGALDGPWPDALAVSLRREGAFDYPPPSDG